MCIQVHVCTAHFSCANSLPTTMYLNIITPTARKIFSTMLFLGAIALQFTAQTPILSNHQHASDHNGKGCLIDLLLQQKKAANADFAEKHNAMDRNIREHLSSG